MTDDTTRIERIEQRAKGLGWAPDYFQTAIEYICDAKYGDGLWDYNDQWCDVAEALLSLYEPAPVVDVDVAADGTCGTYCDLMHNCGVKNWQSGGIRSKDCPGPAPDGKQWVLVLRSKVEVDYE